MFASFSDLMARVVNYLLQDPLVTISLIGILFLYFGYYSNVYTPIKTERLHLYLSGLLFISRYIILQLGILYLMSGYVTSSNLLLLFSLIILFNLFVFFFSKVYHGSSSLRLKFLFIGMGIIAIVLLIFIIKNKIYELKNLEEMVLDTALFNLIILAIFYHGVKIIANMNIKTRENDNSYNYKDFYQRINKNEFISILYFLYPIRLLQRIYFDLFFGGEKKSEILRFIWNSFLRIFDEQKLKLIGFKCQSEIFGLETWINSLFILISFYLLYLYDPMSLMLRLLLSVFLFFALTSIAIEYSINENGFLLIDVYPKNGVQFRCRLIEMSKDFIKVILRGDGTEKTFNPVEYYPITEISKITCVSMREMLDET